MANEVHIKVTGDARSAVDAFGQAERAAKSASDKMRSHMGGAEQASKKLLDALTSLPAVLGVTGVAGGLTAAGTAAVVMAGKMEQARIGFGTLLGSAQAADAFLRQLQDFAAKTPFQFTELQDAARRFLAMGFAASEVIPTLRAVGDAVAALGGGSEMINRVVMALGQIRAKGRVQQEELLQLAEAGIPAYEMLAKAIGKNVPDALKEVEKGSISASVAIDAIVTGMAERFPSMMEKNARTILGQLSNIKDSGAAMMIELGNEIIKALDLSNKLDSLNKALVDLTDTLRNQGLQGVLAKVFPPELAVAVGAIGGAITASLVPALYATATAATAAGVALLPLAALGAGIGGLGLAIATNFLGIRDILIQTATIIVVAWNNINTAVQTAFREMRIWALNFFADMAQRIADMVRDWPKVGEAMANSFEDGARRARAAIQQTQADIQDSQAKLEFANAIAIMKAKQAMGTLQLAPEDSIRDWDEQIRKATAAAAEVGPKLDGPPPAISGAAQRAKTALEELGLSADVMRRAMDMIKMPADAVRDVLQRLGVEAIDAGPLLDGLGVTAEKLAAAFDRAGRNGKELVAQVQAAIAAKVAEEEAKKAAEEQKRATEDLRRAQEDARQEAERFRDRLLALADTAMNAVRPAFASLFEMLQGGSSAGMLTGASAALNTLLDTSLAKARAAAGVVIPAVTVAAVGVPAGPLAADITAAQSTAQGYRDSTAAIDAQTVALRGNAAGWEIIAGILGKAKTDLAGLALTFQHGALSAEQATKAFASGVAVLEATAKAGGDTTNAVGALTNALDASAEALKSLPENLFREAGAVQDALRQLTIEFQAGRISAEQYAAGVAPLIERYKELGKEADATAEKIRQFDLDNAKRVGDDLLRIQKEIEASQFQLFLHTGSQATFDKARVDAWETRMFGAPLDTLRAKAESAMREIAGMPDRVAQAEKRKRAAAEQRARQAMDDQLLNLRAMLFGVGAVDGTMDVLLQSSLEEQIATRRGLIGAGAARGAGGLTLDALDRIAMLLEANLERDRIAVLDGFGASSQLMQHAMLRQRMGGRGK